MVRNVYANWEFGSRPVELRTLLALTGPEGFHQLRHLSEEWRINWAAMLDGIPGSTVPVNMAENLDSLLARQMHLLPDRFFSASQPKRQDFQLRGVTQATLLRQRLFKLSSGQMTAAAVNAAIGGGPQIPVLDPQDIISALSIGLASGASLAEFLEKTGMHGATPLWLYCLAESRAFCNGKRFGPLTSRVVMETIHAAIEAAPDGIIAPDGQTCTFTDGESLSGRTEFHLSDLIDCASTYS